MIFEIFAQMHNVTPFPTHSLAEARRFRSCNLLFTIVYYEGGMEQHATRSNLFLTLRLGQNFSLFYKTIRALVDMDWILSVERFVEKQ